MKTPCELFKLYTPTGAVCNPTQRHAYPCIENADPHASMHTHKGRHKPTQKHAFHMGNMQIHTEACIPTGAMCICKQTKSTQKHAHPQEQCANMFRSIHAHAANTHTQKWLRMLNQNPGKQYATSHKGMHMYTNKRQAPTHTYTQACTPSGEHVNLPALPP